MKVIIPTFNCERWIERTLASAAGQDHPDVDVLVIDDASEDDTGLIAEPLCDKYGFTYHRNTRNERAGRNLYHGIHSMQPHPDEPVFILDGDDFLPHTHVLTRVEEEYEDPDVWFLYGQYEPWPHNTGQVGSRPIPDDIINGPRGAIRRAENFANHPITFRYFLFAQLDPTDFQDKDRHWLRAGYDRCLVVPMLELARKGHYRFVDEILYAYNAVNPISDTNVNLPAAQAAHRTVLQRPPRKPLAEPLPHRTPVAP